MTDQINFKEIIESLDYGVITLDENLRIIYCNRWIFNATGKQTDQMFNVAIEQVFPELSNSRFLHACIDAIKLGLPAKLSNSFNPSPLPLYQSSFIGDELYRLQQTTVIKPGKDKSNKPICEVYIQDVTPVVSKEFLLKRMASDHEKMAKHHEDEKNHLSLIINNTADAIITFEQGKEIQMSNHTGIELLGYSEKELYSLHFEDLLQPNKETSSDSTEKLRVLLENAINNGITSKTAIATYTYHKNGLEIPVQIKFSRTFMGEQQLIVAILRDTSAQVAADKILKESESRFRNLAKIAPVGIFQTDEKGVLTYTNAMWNNITGLPESSLNESSWYTHISGSFKETIEDNWRDEAANFEQFSVEYCFSREKEPKWVLCQLMEERSETNTVLGYVGTITDITEQRNTRDKIEHLAFYDPLTSLANRRLFKDRLSQSITNVKRTNKRMALLNLDLDEFKRVNDSLGHDAGDQLLVTISKRLTAAVREQDTVARIGGDEFSIILNDLDRPSDAAIVAEKIIESVSKPVSLGSQSITMTFSIGIATAPDDSIEPASLVKNADIAMYSVKERSKNSFNFFTSSMNERAIDRLSLENEIRFAIENREFNVKYQPQLNIETGKIIGAEALARWDHSTRKAISPAEFIPVAENSNLILPLGELMLFDACKGASKLVNKLEDSSNFTLAVNLSTKQLMDKNLVSTIKAALKEADLSPLNLELEITESALMENIGETVKVLNALKEIGVKIAIDDFGTGYSSLNYLKSLPVDRLKIDQSFIFDVMTNQRDRDIVTAIIALAHSLKMEVIAEGIETYEQWKLLKKLKCDFGQGYYISKPTDLSNIIKDCNTKNWVSCKVHSIK